MKVQPPPAAPSGCSTSAGHTSLATFAGPRKARPIDRGSLALRLATLCLGPVWLSGCVGGEAVGSFGGVAGADGSSADGAGGGGGGGGVATQHRKPGCLDGSLHEPGPTADASIEALVAGYDKSQALQLVVEVLALRYPTGRFLVEEGIAKGQQNCFELFLPASQRGSAKQVLDRIEVLVHECGHFYDLAKGGFSGAHYHIADGVTRTCKGGSSQFGGKTFARSLLQGDAYAPLRPDCAKGKGSHGCDSYAKIYLSGDPKDQKFESGDQGFDMLHEETVQYVHSLATQMGMRDRVIGATSARDGILTFLWYTERYLRMARLDYPEVYTLLRDDPCWREAILLTWGRAWRFLAMTADEVKLGIDDDQLVALVEDPELLHEIELLRIAEGCK